MSDELAKLVAQAQTKDVDKGKSTEGIDWLEFQRELLEQKREIASALEKTNEVCRAGEAALSEAYMKLETYATNKLPLLIKAGVESIAQAEIKGAVEDILLTLKKDAGGVSADVENCRRNLRNMTWNWRLFVGQIATGIVSALIAGGMIYYGVLGEFRRYAVWGKRVALKVESYSPKTRDILFQDFGGRP